MNPASPAQPTAPIEEALHIKTLLNYLPIIILSVILLIGFVSWDVMANNWAVFTTLLIVCLIAGFVNFLNPYRFLAAKDALLFPPAPTGAPAMSLWVYFFMIIALLGGIGLGFGSLGISKSNNTYDPSKGLMWIGGTLLVITFILLIAAAIKIFGDWVKNLGYGGQYVYDSINGFFSTYGIAGGIIACIVVGIPLVVRGNEIADKTANPEIGDVDKEKFKQDLATSGANTMLSVGVILQIIGLAVVGYFIWQNHGNQPKYSKIAAGIMAVLWVMGPIFVSKSQRGPGFGSDNTAEIGSFENKPFLVHGIIYIIIGFAFLLLLLGVLSVKQTIIYKGAFGLLIVAFLVFISVSLWYVIKESTTLNKDELIKQDSPYYQQLQAEVTKDLQKKSVDGAAPSDDAVKTEMERRLDEKIKTPNHVVMGVFYALSIVIAVMILLFYNVRLKMADCGYIPGSFGWGDALAYVFKNSACPAAVQANGDTSLSGLGEAYPTKVKDDKMLSSDWDTILSKKDTPAGSNNFNVLFVRFAKWFSLIPFLSIILIVMWVSILFTNITTDPRTSVWIAGTFTGDMFPRVKELLDTFFIVLIVGLLLCGILLLPIVKELNVGGLDSILKFAESIQVWQYTQERPADSEWKRILAAVFGFCAVAALVLSGWWTYLLRPNKQVGEPNIPDNWGWYIAFAGIFALCSIPAWYHGIPGGWIGGSTTDPDFAKEWILTRILRLFFTTIYLVPLLIVTLFKAVLYGILVILTFSGVDSIKQKFSEELDKLNFANWGSTTTDLRMFPLDNKLITPASVTSVAAGEAAAPVPGAAPPATSDPVGIDETKVSAVGKLIKVILLTITFVILILSIIYYVYKIDATNRAGGAEQDVASGGFVAQMNSPTAHTIYVIMAIVAIAGFVAYLRDKFKTANQKTPEDYLFNDFKPEDISSPMRQLTFGMTHIIYVVLMVIVWVYDTEKDEKDRMSVTGMTVLGLAILFFHYGLEFIDNKLPKVPGAGGDGAGDDKPAKMAPMTNLLGNIRFIMNTIFFVILCALAYYKQHGVMVALIVFMFLFHLTKSIIGVKLLKLLWACIIYIPCLFLDFLQGSQNAVGDTTRPIWIIVAIELLLIAILYGGPYLLNYIGASASQIVGTPVSLKQLYDTNLTTQSKEIFIYHNTGDDRTPEDKAANCPAEEKTRYHYSISGWFFLNNNVTTKNTDLEIFNFGDVPRLTYNPSRNELKLYCHQLSRNSSITDETSISTEIYNSRTNYNAVMKDGSNSNVKRTKIQILTDNEELDADVQLQRWNYFVVNYDGKTMDFFLNNQLIFKSDFMMPDIKLKPITVGSTPNNRGLNGSICNFAFHKYPLTKEQIRWTYTMLKTQNPPIIGMPTIEDDVKAAGSTTMYSR
jgi:hypothetical protein